VITAAQLEDKRPGINSFLWRRSFCHPQVIEALADALLKHGSMAGEAVERFVNQRLGRN
jgi:hypothetical protein